MFLFRLAALWAGCALIASAVVAGEGAGVVGRVVLAEGVGTDLRRVVNRTDPEVCGPFREVSDLLVSDSGGVVGALVWVEGVPESTLATQVRIAGQTVKELDNLDCEFSPVSLTIQAGEPLDLVSSDGTLHTVHWRGPTEENVALPLRSVRVVRHLREPGIYSIRCDVHPWMRAWIRVDDHPFHAATDGEGRFRILGLPPGTFTVVVWHERLGRVERSVKVLDGVVEEVDFVLGQAALPVPP